MYRNTSVEHIVYNINSINHNTYGTGGDTTLARATSVLVKLVTKFTCFVTSETWTRTHSPALRSCLEFIHVSTAAPVDELDALPGILVVEPTLHIGKAVSG